MEFKYKYRLKPSDLWQFHMYYAYSSYLCIINIICILSSIVLIIKLWANSPTWFRVVLIFFLSLFTVIQPLSIFFRSVKQLKNNNDELMLTFSDSGIDVFLNQKNEHKTWDQIINIIIKPTLIVIYTDREHGYILANRVLKNTRKDFIKLINEKRQRSR